jgi:hypothetical protein
MELYTETNRTAMQTAVCVPALSESGFKYPLSRATPMMMPDQFGRTEHTEWFDKSYSTQNNESKMTVKIEVGPDYNPHGLPKRSGALVRKHFRQKKQSPKTETKHVDMDTHRSTKLPEFSKCENTSNFYGKDASP